eukprot:1493617-Prymnesium_polylepis.1
MFELLHAGRTVSHRDRSTRIPRPALRHTNNACIQARWAQTDRSTRSAPAHAPTNRRFKIDAVGVEMLKR